MNKMFPYHSFCWVIGTTSFRMAQLNLKIEEQLMLLDEFHNIVNLGDKWKWDNTLQEKYYDFMKSRGFVKGKAKRKDKDAREKTSGLVDIGLISKDREITGAGHKLLGIVNGDSIKKENIFNIDDDAFLYLKQLLKTTITIEGKVVRPYIVALRCLLELEELSYEEFTYLLPLIIDETSVVEVISSIKSLRNGHTTVENVIYNRLMSMSNYQEALAHFENNQVNEELICSIGMNRKSKSYDKAYYPLYKELEKIFINGMDAYGDLLDATKQFNNNVGVLWRNLIFITTSAKNISKDGKKAIKKDCPFLQCHSTEELKKEFFKYLHVYKAKATLSDYFDLNRRYFGLTNTIIFEDDTVKLDLIPKYIFQEAIDDIYELAYTKDDRLADDIELAEIHKGLDVNMDKVLKALSEYAGVAIQNFKQALTFIEDDRFRRFNMLIDKKFGSDVLLELLQCFEERDDRRIEELVPCEATVPTIFEYILGIIWYEVSERQGNILDFMKLSLAANLMPKTHASGGSADIVYEYETGTSYPRHSLLIEATLSDKHAQRRMEMEPVSRHLGDYRVIHGNPFDYSLFISTYIHPNIVHDFTVRKVAKYELGGEVICGMKIIPLNTDTLKKIIAKKITYSDLYNTFDYYYDIPVVDKDWKEDLLDRI